MLGQHAHALSDRTWLALLRDLKCLTNRRTSRLHGVEKSTERSRRHKGMSLAFTCAVQQTGDIGRSKVDREIGWTAFSLVWKAGPKPKGKIEARWRVRDWMNEVVTRKEGRIRSRYVDWGKKEMVDGHQLQRKWAWRNTNNYMNGQ